MRPWCENAATDLMAARSTLQKSLFLAACSRSLVSAELAKHRVPSRGQNIRPFVEEVCREADGPMWAVIYNAFDKRQMSIFRASLMYAFVCIEPVHTQRTKGQPS